MYAEKRHDAILRTLRERGTVRVAELADQLQVTPVTIRRDITQLANRGALTRVHGGATLPKTTTPGPRSPARRNAAKERTAGILVPTTSYYYHELIQGAQAAAESLDIRLILGVSRYDPGEDQTQIQQLLAAGADGLLLTPSGPSAAWTWIAGLAVPVVLVERRQPAELDPVECVASDHEHGVIQALRHLVGLGHRRISLITAPTPTSPWLHTGFQSVAHRFGLAGDVPQLAATEADELDGVVDDLLAAGTTAIIAHPDWQAVTILRDLQARGLAVPDDMAIVAYDDEIAALADVPLTAVATARRALGRIGLELLAQRMRGTQSPVMRHIQLLPRLHVRSSTQPPA